MAVIFQDGTVNLASLIIPDVYIDIVPPQVIIRGVNTSRLGLVGVASWGPINKPVIDGNFANLIRKFGNVTNRPHDLMTAVAIAAQQGAADLCLVRVTDGTDAAATASIQSGEATATALYTGVVGNMISVNISNGSRASTHRVLVSVPGGVPEIYDNIPGSGAVFWDNMSAAINTGAGVNRGPSQLIRITASTGSEAPTSASYTLTGGTDGAAGVTDITITGLDGTTRTGMYALRASGCSVAALVDCTDSTYWLEQAAFGLAEGIYVQMSGPSSDDIASAVARKHAAGLDTYSAKLMHGDWIYWNDATNNITRLVSPALFTAGKLVALSPQKSSLNKPLNAVVGSERSGQPGSGAFLTYSGAELETLFRAGIDVITNPIPRGFQWGVRGGFNSSTQAELSGDEHSRMTFFISATMAAALGVFDGENITADHLTNIRSAQLGFLGTLMLTGILGSLDGKLPYSVKCDTGNNDPVLVAQGYVISDTKVRYLAVNRRFIARLQGGVNVVVENESTGSF